MSRSALERRAIEVVRSEMRLYDQLSRRSKLRFEAPTMNTLDAIADERSRQGVHGTRSCAHGRALHEPCSECTRDENDCKAYRVAATQRLKDLLKQLGE